METKVLGGESHPFFFKGSEVKYDYLSSKYILQRTSEYEIFKKYCTPFEEINRGFCSELRVDKNPDCYIFNNSEGKLLYVDFAKGLRLNCFGYVMYKYGLGYKEALKAIYEGLQLSKVTYREPIEKVTKLKTILNIQTRPYNIKDYEFWGKYGIKLKTLEDYNVFACKSYNYIKGEKNYTFYESYNNPIYAYRFVEDGQYFYKIYRPYADKKFKFMFNGTVNCIEGYDQLPLHGDLLIITKSLKDCMTYREIGYSAISLQGEHNPLQKELLEKLRNRFEKIILNFDSDKAGKEAIEGYFNIKGEWVPGLAEQYNLPYFYIDKAKDLSDFVKEYGLEEGKKLIEWKIKRVMKK
jgi:hypothetical protein